MANKQTKRIVNWGWMTSEQHNLCNLEKQAAKGWLLESTGFCNFKLRRGAPVQLGYAVDWPPCGIDETEYLALFRQAGWQLVCRDGGAEKLNADKASRPFYIFSAPKGTAIVPPHTDQQLLAELRQKRLRTAILCTCATLVLSVLSVVLFRTLRPTSRAVTILWVAAGGLCGGSFGVSATILWSLLFRKQRF